MIDGGWAQVLDDGVDVDPAVALDQLASPRTLEILERRRKGVRRRGWLVRRLLLAADLAALLAAFGTAEVAYVATNHGRFGFGTEVVFFGISLPVWIVVARLYGLYQQDDRRASHTTLDEVVQLFHMLTVGAWLLFGFAWVTGVAHPAVPKLLVFWAAAVILLPVARSLARAVAHRRLTYLQNTVIVGAGDIGQGIAEKLLRHPEYGFNLVGFVDSEPKDQRSTLEHLTILGPPERLEKIIRLFDVERVIVAFSRDRAERMLEILRGLKDPWLQVDIVPRYLELTSSNVSISAIEGVPLLTLPPRGLPSSARVLKRSFDIVGSALALLVLAVPFAVIAVAIKLTSKGPVFFRQLRIGTEGRELEILKFRTMVLGADDQKDLVAHLNAHARPGGDPRMFKIPDDPRTTGVGRFLRRRSLDEFPQLFNVLKGEMSLVGPRPLIPEEDQLVDEWGRTRLDLKPGMTGAWQVGGRSVIPFAEMVKLDYLYVTTWSPWNDLRLLCATVPALVKGGQGAY